MSGIVRVTKNGNYFVASNQPFNDKRLSWEARGVMGYLLSKPDGWVTRNTNLIAMGPAGKHKMGRILTELKNFGYMNRVREKMANGQFRWVTDIYESPGMNPEYKPSPENQDMGKPYTGNQGMEPSSGFPATGDPATGNQGIYINTEKEITELEVVSLIFDWIGFVGDAGQEMKYKLTAVAALAWAYWIKADARKTLESPAGFAASSWRKGKLPQNEWCNLAKAWLYSPDDRVRLMEVADAALSYGGRMVFREAEIHLSPIGPAFYRLWKKTSRDNHEVAPPLLMPIMNYENEDEPPPEDEEWQSGAEELAAFSSLPNREDVNAAWLATIDALGHQGAAFRQWLPGTTLRLNGRSAFILVGSDHARDWVNGRLLESIERTLTGYLEIANICGEYSVTAVCASDAVGVIEA